MTEPRSNDATPKPRPMIVPRLHHLTFMALDIDAMVCW